MLSGRRVIQSYFAFEQKYDSANNAEIGKNVSRGRSLLLTKHDEAKQCYNLEIG